MPAEPIPENTEHWKPLLDGRLAEEARQVVAEIADALPATEPSAALAPAPDLSMGPSLSNGSAGLAVLFSYLAEDQPQSDFADRAEQYLEHAIQGLAGSVSTSGLYTGLTGIAWASSHLAGRLYEAEEDEEDATGEIDEYLLRLLEERDDLDFDLVSGLAGLAVYCLEGPPRPVADQCLELIVERFAATSRPLDDGLSWLTPVESMPPAQRLRAPSGYYNLGVAHGVPGAIAALASILGAGVAAGRCSTLIEEAVRWILAQRQDPEVGTFLPYWIIEGGEPRESRLAWCYGDLGVAAALLPVSRQLARSDWERAVVELARVAARRSFESSGVVDAGICHGAAGAGHLFNRLAQATGDAELVAAARFWFEKTLDMRHPWEGLAGYRAWDRDPRGNPSWVVDPGILIGAAGVALAFQAAVSPIEPEWDRILLTSGPPRRS